MDGIAYKRHKDAIANFNKNYVKPEIFSRNLGRRISEAEEIRHASDYDDFYIATKDEAEEQIKTAKELVEQINLLNSRKEWTNMTRLRMDAMELLEQIPEDKLVFIIQIMQGVKGLYTKDENLAKREAFDRLEKMRKKVFDLDYDKELADYREEKYGYADIS